MRRVHISDVELGIGSQPDQTDFYIADNILEGRLAGRACTQRRRVQQRRRPARQHANDDGIHLAGLRPRRHAQPDLRLRRRDEDRAGRRAVGRLLGNDVLWTYDNGIELDSSRCATRERCATGSRTRTRRCRFQPIYGGPAYAIRNVLVNVADEEFKLHANGTTPTVGAVIYHTTVLRDQRAIQCSTATTPYLHDREQPVHRAADDRRRPHGALGRAVGRDRARPTTTAIPRRSVRVRLRHGRRHDLRELRGGRGRRHVRDAWPVARRDERHRTDDHASSIR